MDDLSLVLTLFKDQPWIVAAVFIIFAKEIIEIIQKYVVPLFRKKKTIEQILTEDAGERKARQAEYDKKFGEYDKKFADIEDGLSEVKNAIAANDELTSKTSEGTLVNHLFGDTLWPFLRLKAFRRLLAMRKNGRIKAKGLQLILQHKDEWLNVLDTELGIDIVDADYYNAELADIKKRVYDDFSKSSPEKP